jgi:hypothetical protein
MKTDAWGNFRSAPVKTIEESHEGNFLKLFIYEHDNTFLFGYQLKLGGVVKQKMANIGDTAYKTSDEARIAGCREIQAVGKANRSMRKVFAEFSKIRYDEPELFGEDLYG